jgi:mannan endo-1,4-beta-mannosidase
MSSLPRVIETCGRRLCARALTGWRGRTASDRRRRERWLAVAAVLLALQGWQAAAAPLHQSADPELIPQGRLLLDWLHALPKRTRTKVISGQFHYTGYVDAIRRDTGKWVGLVGETVIHGERDPWVSIDEANVQALIKYWKAGGIVQENFKMHNFKTRGSIKDRDFLDADLDAAIQEGTPVNTNLKAWLDVYATFAQRLEDQNIPLLIRPLHEANCCYFYQKKEPERIKRLWIYIFNYLTKTKRIHNLIFVYAAAAYKRNAHVFYPGNAYVDIVGIDLYKDLTGDRQLNATDFSDYRTMLPYGKPFALAEFGPFHAIDQNPTGARADYRKLMAAIKAYAPNTVYWMSWSVHWSMLPSRNDFVPELLADPWTIVRAEIPNFRQ